MTATARSFRVTGRVQGVAFRAWTRSTALGLGLSGWVRNESDGSVTGHIEGPRTAVDQMVTQLHEGPGAASVRAVETGDAVPEGAAGFEIRR